MKKLATAALVALALATAALAETAILAIHPSKPNLILTWQDDTRGKIFSFEPLFFGPNWGHTPPGGKFAPHPEGGIETRWSGKLGNTANVICEWSARVEKEGPRTLRFSGKFSVSADTNLQMALLTFNPGVEWRGKDRLTVVHGDDTETLRFNPPNRGNVSGAGVVLPKVKSMRVRNAAGQEIIITYDTAQDMDCFHDNLQWPIVDKHIKADEPRAWWVTIELPFDVEIYPVTADLPVPADLDRYFAWTARADTGPSVIGIELEAPAGKHGRIRSVGDKLMYNGKPIKMWGINNCYGSNGVSPPKALAEQRAAIYSKYGINAVRLQRFAGGIGWEGNLSPNSGKTYREDPDATPAMDYYVKCLKDAGIYVYLSANFGTRIGPDDRADIPYINELGGPDGAGFIRAPDCAMWWGPEVQDIQIAQMVNILNRVNTATGIRYADDPCVYLVEIINENCTFFYNIWGSVRGMPTLKRMAGEQFRDWLHAKYGTEEAMLAAWGPVNYNGVPDQGTEGESWDGVIYPAGNPWYWDNLGPDGNSFFWDKPHPSGKHDGRWPRLVDTALFLYDLQNKFFDRFVAAVRATGYEGEIIAGNWHAGSGLSHYLNLLSDHRIGMVDRHNYHGEYWSMFSRPGSSLLSTGLNTQMSDRPYMMSEWIHEAKGFPHFNIDPTAPRAFDIISEGPVLFAAYGMCLNGWDGAFIFQNQDAGRFSGAIHSTWDPFLPGIVGLYPAVARMVLRGDVRESEQLFSRNISMKSLEKGVIGFNDILASAGHDNRDVSSAHIPEQVIAVGRAVVTLNDEPTPTDSVDPSQFMVDGRYVSSTGELTWRPGENIRDGDITINAPRSQGIAGFTRGRKAELADVDIVTTTPYAVIYVTSLDDAQPVATAKNVLITALARIRNTDQRMAGDSSMDWGRGPILMEPVVAEITVKRPGAFTVHILDQDGRRTGETLPVEGRVIKLDTAENKTIYYEIEF